MKCCPAYKPFLQASSKHQILKINLLGRKEPKIAICDQHTMMLCAISGEPAKEPVLSPKSGSIFEKTIILNLLKHNPKDPINDQPLTEDELITVNNVQPIVSPKPPTVTSIPSLLSTFQNEWDSIAIEIFTLRKQLHKARQELSAALYHHDAAVRVTAKAIKERDEARKALQQLAVSLGKGSEIGMDIDTQQRVAPPTSSIPVDEINDAREKLFAIHKAQKFKLSIGDAVELKTKERLEKPFVKSSCAFIDNSNKKIVVGSPTGSTALIDLKTHSVVKVAYKKSDVYNVSLVKTSNGLEPLVVLKENIIKIGLDPKTSKEFPSKHTDTINTIKTHPLLKHLFLIFSKDGSWSLNNSLSNEVLHHSQPITAQYVTGDIHVDGALIAAGTSEGKVQIINLTDGQLAAEFTVLQHINEIFFGPNGYWLFVSSSDEEGSAKVDVFDLRKGVTTAEITIDGPSTTLAIDPSSQILFTVSGPKISLHRYLKKNKSWETGVSVFNDGGADIIGFSWTGDNENLTKFSGVSAVSQITEYELAF